MSERVTKLIKGDDGCHEVEILARDDGLFRFVECSQFTEDGRTFWTPTYFLGLYKGGVTAEQEARAILLWLRSQNPS
jgi:hypothetical protein